MFLLVFCMRFVCFLCFVSVLCAFCVSGPLGGWLQGTRNWQENHAKIDVFRRGCPIWHAIWRNLETNPGEPRGKTANKSWWCVFLLIYGGKRGPARVNFLMRLSDRARCPKFFVMPLGREHPSGHGSPCNPTFGAGLLKYLKIFSAKSPPEGGEGGWARAPSFFKCLGGRPFFGGRTHLYGPARACATTLMPHGPPLMPKESSFKQFECRKRTQD